MIKALKNILFLNKDRCYICLENKVTTKKYICETCYGNIEIKEEGRGIGMEYFEEIYTSVLYNRFVEDIIRKYKFQNKNYLSKPLGELLIDFMLESDLRNNIDLIVPVPMYRKKESIRGYNQSYLLAKHMGRELDIEVSRNNLIKIKNTRPQSSLGAVERRNNLKNSFYLKNEKEFKNRKILLIDDIITTGSTLKECARTIYESTEEKLYGLTIA